MTANIKLPAMVIILFVFALCAWSPPALASQEVLKLKEPPALKSEPVPGLEVVYIKIGKRVRHVEDMPSDKRMLKRGDKGKPLAILDHSFGTGKVFDSGRSWFVGMLINGLIKLDAPGRYSFRAMANDGIQISIAGQMISDDGEWHSSGDRLSPEGQVEVAEPGWYELKIKYFQRKGSSTLRMFWKRPEQKDFSVIPASAYGHEAPF